MIVWVMRNSTTSERHPCRFGCCFSTSRDDNRSAYATQAITEERRPVASSHSNTAAVVPPNSARVVIRSAPDHLPLNENFNAPIRRHVWYSKRRLWTRAQLDQERKEFFETRVTGRTEVWAALSASISFMQTGDLTTAQSIIDAAGVTVPTGDLCQGCYDEQGVLYRLPQCIVANPENMVQSNLADDDFDTDDAKLSLDEESGDELIADDAERRRDEKGKISERDLIRVKARLSDRGGPDLIVTVGKTQNIAYIARKLQQEAEIPKTQRIKIAYLGKILKEHLPLIDQGWKPGHVINALVVTRRSPSC
ncbi:ubiquitin domain-containing protein [Aspergillus alliaceus]|uniref:ubiquitin domain-containing protein n=1 Tax=Petromyces alliaceus TaxID=209559 RepID=UPI0012A6C3B1|nr:uncharacterized protein BDW43DRAFT_305824 [Aspergillus alliaceus]KAB8238936.1 hypothetical protein BDW43DRAFT_305824 [Aspergillus alliaceus]